MVQQIKLKLVAAVVCTFVLSSLCCYGQTEQPAELSLYFRSSSSVIDPDYMDNRAALDRMAGILSSKTDTILIESIEISGYTSPEGPTSLNQRLSDERAAVVRAYIEANFSHAGQRIIAARGMGVDWVRLRKLVVADSSTILRAKILDIIDNVPAAINVRANTSRKKALMDLGVPAWNYMLHNHFSAMRVGVSVVIMLAPKPPAAEVPVVKVEQFRPVVPQEVVIEEAAAAVEDVPPPTAVFVSAEPVKVGPTEWRPLFAVKTNLLFNAASILNIEAEVPIGERWSVAGEWIFPWWLWEKKQICLQVLSGNIEGRYWLGNRQERPKLTGWFAGLYMGAGYYDLEWKTKGYQGEFFIAAGLSGGYTHTINRSGTLRMEYALGMGYLQTKYREYKPLRGGEVLLRQRNGRYSWLGPTRAKISLVWMINYKRGKGGAK